MQSKIDNNMVKSVNSLPEGVYMTASQLPPQMLHLYSILCHRNT